MKKAVLTSLFLVLVTSLWAQTPEWTEYCRLQKIVRYEDLPSDSAYCIYYQMDSIYNGIPLYLDLFSYLEDNTLENRLWIVEDLEHLNDRRENMLLEPLNLSDIELYDEKELFRGN